MPEANPVTHISTPIQHELVVDTRYVSHVRALLSHEMTPGFYRTDDEAMMAKQTEITNVAPSRGGKSSGPEKTSITVVVNSTTTLFDLAYYWGRRELSLRQRDGVLDNIS